MTAGEKHQEEKDEIKNNRMNRILSSAFILFSEKGIDTIAMTDIAKKAEIGVASLYRYYETKDQIAICVAIWAWQKEKLEMMKTLSGAEYEKLSGLEKLSLMCEMFVHLFENQGDFLRFIYFFDSYVVRQEINAKKLVDYEAIITEVQNVVLNAISDGVKDNSIELPKGVTKDELYFTLMHSLFSTAQKLTLSGNMLVMDSKAQSANQLRLLGRLLIKALKK